MLESPARVWARAGEVIIAPPLPIRPFIDALKAHCRGARYSQMGWIIPTPLADCAVDLLREHFPVIHDSRPNALPPPPFVDGPAADPLARLDLMPILRPAAPALRALHYERHPARAAFTQIAEYDPTLLAGLGLAESLDERWVVAYAAERFWQDLLRNLESVVTATVQADGSLCEQLVHVGVNP